VSRSSLPRRQKQPKKSHNSSFKDLNSSVLLMKPKAK
jgi:hypothetical protein